MLYLAVLYPLVLKGSRSRIQDGWVQCAPSEGLSRRVRAVCGCRRDGIESRRKRNDRREQDTASPTAPIYDARIGGPIDRAVGARFTTLLYFPTAMSASKHVDSELEPHRSGVYDTRLDEIRRSHTWASLFLHTPR